MKPKSPRKGNNSLISLLKQDGRTDEDYFGSRGSLTASTPCTQTQHQLPLNRSFGSSRGGSRVTLNMEEDEDDDADLAGSRTSLGSGGLKRWTTEENLSSNGSREGKIDLLDGSHSNSTGNCENWHFCLSSRGKPDFLECQFSIIQ